MANPAGEMEAIRILIVDNDKSSALALAELLRDEGYAVAVAGDGIEGLDQARRFEPRVALLDVEMPRMNGLRLRDELARLPDPPSVIFVSVRRLPTAAAREPFLAKPIDFVQLLGLLTVAAASRRRQQDRAVIQ
jgi:CheY-like chemotaxis protein